MFTPSREEARDFLFEAWRKARAGELLSPLESMAADAIALHPEYHQVLENPGHYREREYLPQFGETNPFLHLGLHLAIAEQLSIDQPPGIRAEFERLRARRGEDHAALHQVMECLAEVIWRAQRDATAFDGVLYLECLRRR